MRAQRDLSDWLSPVLVKEMRQGLKSRAFVGAFLVVHLGMLAGIAMGLTNEAAAQMREVTAGLFWGVSVLSLLGIVPLLGFNAVSVELKGRTFELMALTRLTAWRVVTGKWASLVAQAALIVSSLLPYLVARYFIGGVNLVLELLMLGLLLFAASCMVAMSVFVSTFEAQLARLLMIVAQLGVSLAGIATVTAAFAAPMRSSRPVVTDLLPGVGAVLVVSVLVVLFVLQAAATRVAPPAENHAVIKRGVALLLLVTSLLPGDADLRLGILVALVPALLLVSLEACAERISSTPSTYLPFARWPAPLRPVSLALYPGWPSGLLFCALMALATGGLLSAQAEVDAAQGTIAGLAFLAAITLPTALARLPKKLGPVGFVAAFTHLLLFLIAALAAEALRMSGAGGDAQAAGVVSPLLILLQAGSGELDAEMYGAAAIACAGYLLLCALLLAWRGRADLTLLAGAERRARGGAPPA